MLAANDYSRRHLDAGLGWRLASELVLSKGEDGLPIAKQDSSYIGEILVSLRLTSEVRVGHIQFDVTRLPPSLEFGDHHPICAVPDRGECLQLFPVRDASLKPAPRPTKSAAEKKLDAGMSSMVDANPRSRVRCQPCGRKKAKTPSGKFKPDYSSGEESASTGSEKPKSDLDTDDEAFLVSVAVGRGIRGRGRARGRGRGRGRSALAPGVPCVPCGVDHWEAAGLGTFRFSIGSGLLGAHCPLGGTYLDSHGKVQSRPHGPGPCRLNRTMAKKPIGMLAAWLAAASDYDSRDCFSKFLNTAFLEHMFLLHVYRNTAFFQHSAISKQLPIANRFDCVIGFG